MFNWLLYNLGTIITLFIVVIAMAAAIAVIKKDRKKGKSLCGNNCTCCPMKGKCHEKQY